jgi:seryl-tRNA synthetase
MLDMKFIRENVDLVRQAILNKGEKADLDKILELDERRRSLVSTLDQLRHERKVASEAIAEKRRKGANAEAEIQSSGELSSQVKELEAGVREVEAELQKHLLWVPNIPHPSVPYGKTEEDNQILREWGTQRNFSFEPRPHWDLGDTLGILDFPRAAKVSGSNFPSYWGLGARLERALVNFMLDLHTQEHGYLEVFPPFLVNRQTMVGTAQLPKLEDDMYLCEYDDLFLDPTAEPPVTGFHQQEVLQLKELPICYVAYTACFRREAGSYGRETKGLLRVHQFNKVEMVRFTHPDTSYREQELMTRHAEEVLRRLEIPYRVACLCTGEMTFAAARCYDIMAWAPGVKKWLEVSTITNFEEFQARRLNIRTRDPDGTMRFVHTLNGSGLATPRTFIALVENYQQEDGSILIPEVLRPYMGGVDIIKS